MDKEFEARIREVIDRAVRFEFERKGGDFVVGDVVVKATDRDGREARFWANAAEIDARRDPDATTTARGLVDFDGNVFERRDDG